MRIFDNGDKGFFVKCTPDEKAKIIDWIKCETMVKEQLKKCDKNGDEMMKQINILDQENRELQKTIFEMTK